jgi:putative membrane protein
MSQSMFTKTALAAALLGLGIASGAQAQAPSSKSATPAPTQVPNSTGQSSTAPGTAPMTPGAPSAKTTSPGKPGASAGKMSTTLASADRKFMEKAAQGGMAEVELGKLAEDKASNDQVKQFGKRMVDDHSKANDQLKSLAQSKGVTLPTEMDKSAQKERDKLAKLSGADFDREYMKHMVSDHNKDVKEFKSESKSAKDADVKSFAASTLPTLEQHLDLAKSTEATVKHEKSASAGAASPTASRSSTAGTRPARNAPAAKSTTS